MLPSRNVVKCFCTLVVTAKRSADELFMHYFHNLSSASGGFAPDPHRDPDLAPLRDFRPHIPNLPTPGKNPAGAHDYTIGHGSFLKGSDWGTVMGHKRARHGHGRSRDFFQGWAN